MNCHENSKASKLNEILASTAHTSGVDTAPEELQKKITEYKSTEVSSLSAIVSPKPSEEKQEPKLDDVQIKETEECRNDEDDEEEEYIVVNSYGIYNWARFQAGPIKASDIKEVYPELHINVIERCVAHLVKSNKMKVIRY